MNQRGASSFPPVGDDSRLDAIVSRGRSLRRRRQLGVGAGASGAVAATALAVLLLTGAPAQNDEQLFANQEPAPLESASTTTTTPSNEMTVRIDTRTTPIRILITDPARPVAANQDETAQQCVLATLRNSSGVAVAGAFACTPGELAGSPAASSEPTVSSEPLPLQAIDPQNGTQIGCAAQVSRVDATIEHTTESVSSSFQLSTPASLTAGDYELDVSGVSGIGDGCEGTTPGSSEVENVASDHAELSLP